LVPTLRQVKRGSFKPPNTTSSINLADPREGNAVAGARPKYNGSFNSFAIPR
jgi:hypothetical protein